MYSLWKKLTTIEDILLGEATDVVKYFCENYSTATQQIHALFSERAEGIKSSSLEIYPTNSSTFRLFIDTNVTFETLSIYIGFVFHSYNGKSECILNRQLYKQGDIILTDIKNILGSSTLLQTNNRSSDTYNQLYRLYLNSYFPKNSFEHMAGVGFIYEKEKWSFDALVLNSKSNLTLFSKQEQNFIEMQILIWTKKFQNNDKSVYLNAKQMLEDQFNYIFALLQTQRNDMVILLGSDKVNSILKTFLYEIRDQIDSLVYNRKLFNTFEHFRQQNENMKLLMEIYDHRQWMLKLQPPKQFLYSFWKQIQSIESWFENKDYQSIVNYLQLNTFPSIESLLTFPKSVFLDRLGVHPQSDLFDPKLNYIGLLFYLYNDQEKFTVNESIYKRGQLIIRQKETIQKMLPKPTEYDSLFVHEYFYESLFREKPNDKLAGIGFIYEQGKWKYDVIVYSGIHGIHSIYDNRNENLMKISSNEERYIDLILSTIYIHNKWLENLDSMYSIDELINIERSLIREKIELIERFYEQNKNNLVELNEIIHSTFRNFLQQCKPEKDRRKSTSSNLSIDLKRLSSCKSDGNSLELINSSPSPSNNYTSRTSLPDQQSSIPNEQKLKPKKNSNASKPIKKSFPVLSKTRSKSQDAYSSSMSSFNRLESSKHSKKSSNFYQIWRELCDIEQKLLSNSTLDYFRNYLETKIYLNSQQINVFHPPEDCQDEYNLMAKIKIESQLKFIHELYELKCMKLLTHKEKKLFDELFKQFYSFYKTQIEYAKKYSK